MLFLVVWCASPQIDSDGERLRAEILAGGCAVLPAEIDHAGVIEELQHAYQWNRLLADSRLVAIDHSYFSTAHVLDMVDGWTPVIACIAHEFAIPPDLLAGVLALELDLDYHLADAVADGLIRTPFGAGLSSIEMGAGYAGVHFGHLRPALQTMGERFSAAPFYRDYYHLIMTRSQADLTLLSTRYSVIDIANAAAMARYYALLRLGDRPMDSLTVEDMAFVWSAYRGGVVGTPADPRADSRWSLDCLQRADNPRLFGDTIIALPYFAYYRSLYQAVRFCVRVRPGCSSRTEVSDRTVLAGYPP
jgi:hypothetical protein